MSVMCEAGEAHPFDTADCDSLAEFQVTVSDGTWRRELLCGQHVSLCTKISLAPELFWLVEKIA